MENSAPPKKPCIFHGFCRLVKIDHVYHAAHDEMNVFPNKLKPKRRHKTTKDLRHLDLGCRVSKSPETNAWAPAIQKQYHRRYSDNQSDCLNLDWFHFNNWDPDGIFHSNWRFQAFFLPFLWPWVAATSKNSSQKPRVVWSFLMNKQFRPHAFHSHHFTRVVKRNESSAKICISEAPNEGSVWNHESIFVVSMRTYQPFKVQNPLVGIVKAPEKKTDLVLKRFFLEVLWKWMLACTLHLIRWR